ncbi:MAG TPA: hypothetical protein VFW95_04975 [Candidatus Limnocylindria bacterium]|nr:hypothetical protein [Candidatus Limnocylindria bacterium]
MKRPNVAAAPAQRPPRILLVLAVAWLIAAMAIGGLSLDAGAARSDPPTTTVVAEP